MRLGADRNADGVKPSAAARRASGLRRVSSGEVVQAIPGFEFQVLDADPRRVKRVRIVRKRPTGARRRPLQKGEEETGGEVIATPEANPLRDTG